jgi:hypothetical protein
MRENPPAMLVGKSADRMQQVISGPGWETSEIIDRGNQLTSVTFRTERVFETVQEAEAYMMGYEAAGLHPWDQARALFVCETPTGNKVHQMFPAAISAPSFSYHGCRVFAQYTITGGELTAAANAATFLWFVASGDLAPSGEATPAAAQAWELTSGDLRPSASITTDDFWRANGSDWEPK